MIPFWMVDKNCLRVLEGGIVMASVAQYVIVPDDLKSHAIIQANPRLPNVFCGFYFLDLK